MSDGWKSWPSVYIGIRGVNPATSPKSYWNSPRVSFGHPEGSTAITRIFFPSVKFFRRNGKPMPAKLLPPPKHPITMSGSASAISICATASWPMTVWCSTTWFSTLPRQ